MQSSPNDSQSLPGMTPTRERLLAAAKALFSAKGFDNASTVAIARAAQTSESQLVKHFGGKEGLLEAIFEQGWAQVAARVPRPNPETPPAERLRGLLEAVVLALDDDPELQELLLLGGRHVRKEGSLVMLTGGFMNFVRGIDATLNAMKAAGQLRPEMNVEAARSALMGMFEGMLRDRVLARRSGYPANFSSQDVRQMFGVVLGAFAQP